MMGARIMTTTELSQFLMIWMRQSFEYTYGMDMFDVQRPIPDNPYRWGEEPLC